MVCFSKGGKQLKESCFEDNVPILKLSYDHLPSYLKQCFAYCAIFPKDHEIEKEFLIQLWMAQGYVQSPDASQHLEEIGNHYFRDLLSRSFFQEALVEDDNNEVLISYKMHDLIHDLAVRVAGFDCRIVERNANSISKIIRHVSISRAGTKVPTQLMKAKGLRTLLGSGSPHICKVLSKFRCLRILDVSYCYVKKVPKSISKLQYLRYLDLSRNEMSSLPNSIRKLVNLQTLKLSYCNNLERLPEGITKLINLRYLMIDGCWKLNHMPSGMGKLTSLRRLNKFVVGRNKWGLRLSELNGLNELKGDISIEGLENVKDVRSEAKEVNLMAKQYLHSLTLKWGYNEFDRDMDEILLEGLQPHSKLRELSIEEYLGMMFPSWMTTGNIVISLPNIVCITLVSCNRCKHLPQSLDQLPFLKSLTLRWLDRVEHINDDDDDENSNNHRVEERKSSTEGMSVFFPSLEQLVIQSLPNLKGWWRASETLMTGGEEEERASERPSFPRLTRLDISFCRKLTSMPIHPSHLEELYLESVPEKLVRQLLLTSATTTAMAITEGSASSSSSSSSSIPSFSSPLSSKLKSLRIMFIQDLESLPVEVLQSLASLEHLAINSCPRLSSCFAVSEKDEEGFRALPSLRSLSIWGCGRLTSFVSGVTQHLTALQDLTIRYCQNFDLSDDDHGVHWQGLMSLRELVIGEIPKLVSLPVGLQQVTTLQHLEIRDCPGLMALPDWLSNLTSLQRLYISGCSLLSEIYQKETGEDWSKISHIPNIIIDGKYIMDEG